MQGMEKKLLLLLGVLGCRTPAELGPRMPPIRSSRDLVGRLASRAADVKDLYIRGGIKCSWIRLDVEIALASRGDARLVANVPIINKKAADVLVSGGEFWAYLPTEKKLYRGKTAGPLPEGKVGTTIGVALFLLRGETEGGLPEGEGRPGVPPGAGGKWIFFPELSRGSEEQMSVSRGKRHYDVTITRGKTVARALKVSVWSRTPEELAIYDLDRPGEILATVRYTSFRLEGEKLMPRILEIRFAGLKAKGTIRIEKLNPRATFKAPMWKPPRVRKGTEVIELNPEEDE